MIEYFIYNNKDQTLFICSDEKNFAFLNISKNAITSLKSLVLQERGLKGLEHQTIHRMIGHNPNQYNIEPYKISMKEKERGKRYIKFAVMRDPVSRFISTYKLFWMDNFPHAYFDSIKTHYGIDNLDKFIVWAKEYELKKPVLQQDEHLRLQSSWLKEINYLDYIVPIEFLDNFVKNILKISDFKRENVTKHNLHLTEGQVQEIKEIYKTDYDFFEKIPDEIIYKPTT